MHGTVPPGDARRQPGGRPRPCGPCTGGL